MTITEAIKSYPGLSDISDNFISKVLIDRSLTGTVDYAIGYKSSVELCVADIYAFAGANPDFSEGSLNIRFNRAKLTAMAIDLYEQNGEPEKAAKFKPGGARDRTNRW